MVVTMATAMHAASTDKTLVSWVELTDRSQRAGSLLTVQRGDEFDGIVFAELVPDRWMAGSNNFRRTQKAQGEYPAETTDGKTLLQMAIVYKGDTIAIYRNGEPYASYKANNIDLLSGEDNFAVFGVRHSEGTGSIGGAIADARIYDGALSVDQIKALKPKEPSLVEPYAWWDFSGDKFVDRTGRYPHAKLVGADLKDGRLILGKDAMVCAARTEQLASALHRRGELPEFTGPYVPETPEWPENPPDNWAVYHLAHPTFSLGSPFDPNPAYYYKGRYHLHYIYRNHTGFVFAHVSSTDMVHWAWHPTVLAPPNTGHGMFSGTGFFTKEGKPVMVYHGQGSNRNWILYGLDDSLDKWSKPQVMLPKDENGQLMEKVRYFDPDIWAMDGMYYGLNGVSSSEPPQIMKSADLDGWTFLGDLLHPDFDEEKLGVKKDEDISCPNIFKLGGKWVLVCISHKLGCRYFIGDFKDEQFLPEQHALMGGSSRRYFAPESLLTPDGRRVNWTWYHGGHTKGVQSLPTEMELPDDGIMRFRPIRELERLRYDEQSRAGIPVAAGESVVLQGITGDHLELEVVVRKPGEHGPGVDVLCDAQGKAGLQIKLDSAAGRLFVGSEQAPLKLEKGEALTLRIFVDSTLVEVFANERQVVMADKPRQAGSAIDDHVALHTTGEVTFDSVTAWQMKSAFTSPASP